MELNKVDETHSEVSKAGGLANGRVGLHQASQWVSEQIRTRYPTGDWPKHQPRMTKVYAGLERARLMLPPVATPR